MVYFMTMKNKKGFLLLALLVISLIVFLFYKTLQPKYESYKVNLEQEQKISQIKELSLESLKSSGYPDEKKAKEGRKQLCALTARPDQEREKAILAIKEFIDNPSAQVVYQCSDAFYDTTNDKLIPAKSETYLVGLSTFVVNPFTNHIVQVDIKEFAESNKVYSQKEIETKAKEFITKHSDILGTFDLEKLIYELGKKGNGDEYTNYFLTFTGEKQTIKLDPPAVTCSKDINKDTPGIYYQNDGTPCIKNFETVIVPTLQLGINSKGQVLNYSNSFEGEVGRSITL